MNDTKRDIESEKPDRVETDTATEPDRQKNRHKAVPKKDRNRIVTEPCNVEKNTNTETVHQLIQKGVEINTDLQM